MPPHVLRFWETKFPQLRPLKRGGGRRYYRPEDIALLRRIRQCLYHEGYTIRGVQKLLRAEMARGPEGAGGGAVTSADVPLEAALRAALVEVRRELVAIRSLLAALFGS